jgi:fatty-acyl-CoA synthase
MSSQTSTARKAYDPSQTQRWQTLSLAYLLERKGLDLDRTALVFEQEFRTYGQMRTYSRRIANALRAAGIEDLDRVALLSSNRLEFLEIEVGISAARAIMVPLNWRLRRPELVNLLNRSGCRAIFVEDRFAETVQDIVQAGDVPSLDTVIAIGDVDGLERYEDWCAASTEEAPDHGGCLDDPHEIIFTSGTTGDPKGAIWTNGTVLWNSIQQVMDYGLRPAHSTYAVIDLYYIGGRHDFTWPVLHQGGTVHIRRSSNFDAGTIIDYVVDHQITHVLWVPTMLYDILRLPGLAERDTSNLKMIMSGGAPLPRSTIEAASELFPQSHFIQVYGLTEGGGTVSFVPPDVAHEKVGSCGRPSMHNDIRVVDLDDKDCPPGTAGEILVKGPAVTAGYWDQLKLTAQIIQDGWLHTGDVGYFDEDGFLYISGRLKDMIISGGMNIYPAEIEDVLHSHPAVSDVAVIGEPDERWGERVVAVIQRLPGHELTKDEVVAYCSERLASYKKPTTVRFVDDLPRTASGKLQKFKLRAGSNEQQR